MSIMMLVISIIVATMLMRIMIFGVVGGDNDNAEDGDKADEYRGDGDSYVC